jgi:Family of unknown function (DUF5320)
MAQLNGTGPENHGRKTGRGLGQCSKENAQEITEKLGKGMGLRRKSVGGQGKSKRLKSGLVAVLGSPVSGAMNYSLKNK